MKKIFGALPVLVFLFLLSCARPQALQYKGIDRVSLGSVGTQGLQLAFDVKLYNPNPYALRLVGADLDAYINSRLAGKAGLLSSQDVPATDTFILPISVSLDAANLLGNAIDLLTQKEVMVKLDGKVRAGKAKGGPVLPVRVRYEGRQKVQF